MQRAQRPRRRLRPWLVLAVLLCLAGALLAKAGEWKRLAYPQKYTEYVQYYADKYQLDPLMLYAVIRTESGFDPNAQSSVDARGLMQVTEQTFDWIKSKIAPGEPLEFADLYNPETAIRFGSYYFALCLERYEGDLSTAAAAYHSGWGTVDGLLKDPAYSADGRTLHTFPFTQMERYVQKINKSYSNYQSIYKE